MLKDYTDITFVIDRSGSMLRLTNDVVGGYRSFIQHQKTLGSDARVSLVLFDDRYECVFRDVPLTNVSDELTFETGGMTGLLDALGYTIDDVGNRLRNLPETKRPNKVIFVIITDGEENASSKYRLSDVRERIMTQQNAYNWQFIFLGANIDSFQTGANLGIHQWTTSNYASSTVGMRAAFTSASTYTALMREQGMSPVSMANCYDAAIKDEADTTIDVTP